MIIEGYVRGVKLGSYYQLEAAKSVDSAPA